MNSRHHLVTGATGFVGGALVLELLRRTDARVTCVVRPRGGRSAQERLEDSLSAAAGAYGDDDLVPLIADRCRALAGDVTEDRCGVDTVDLAPVDEVWHAAASLDFEERRKAEILRDNLDGTRHVLDLAEALETACFNYVSTAYVAGMRTGWIPAEPVPAGTTTNNAYEYSKIRAEAAVLAAGFARTRILRPSIVIGHSRTLAATSFTGMYGFVNGLSAARAEVRRHLGDMLVFRPLRIRAEADARINFLPVDLVVGAAVGISLADGDSGVYHLANSSQPTVAESLSTLCDLLKIRRPVYVTDAEEFTLIDERVDERLEFYHSYVHGTKDFDLANVNKLVGDHLLDHPLPPARLAEFMTWYLDRRGLRGN